jgi:hypothetical protein
MSLPEKPLERRSLLIAVTLSLLIHGLALYFPRPSAPLAGASPARLEARLQARREEPARRLKAAPAVQNPAPRAASRKPLMTVPKSRTASRHSPAVWTPADKAEMDRFLNELSAPARPPETLAQRSLAMARAEAQQQAREESKDLASLERRPDSPEPDPFSLGLYLEGLLKHLNRSSAYVKNDPRSRGVRKAAVQFRLNPDGTLKSFAVLNAADQEAEIAFIKAVVERAAPFSPFPPDINRAARSLAVRICIQPSIAGGFGFSRARDDQGC